ncbi:YncE family protein [Numidum massiliense]|uniref:hypothetical protein n=1 Tax=Numidum massiliense TaxID=1522315 RepID=UPI0006D58585|nr:hypothetical protein [Numidum massiliense]
MRLKHVIPALLICIFLIACSPSDTVDSKYSTKKTTHKKSTKTVDLDGGSFGLLYTSSIERDAAFAVADEQGDILSSVNFKGQGVERIGSDGKGGYLLPATLGDDTRARIDRNGKMTVAGFKYQHTFADTQNDVQVIIYNTTMDENIMEIRKGEHVRKTTLPSLTRSALVYGKNVYVAVDADHYSYLYIVDIKSGKIKKRVAMVNDYGAVDDMQLFQGKIVMAPSIKGNEFIDHIVIFDLKTEKMKKVFLAKDVTPQFLAVDGDTLYVSTEEGYLFKLDQNYRVQKRVKEADDEDDHYLQQIRVDKDYVYTLTIIPRGDNTRAGYIGVFDKQTLKKVKNIDLPIMRETILKDFVLLNGKGSSLRN